MSAVLCLYCLTGGSYLAHNIPHCLAKTGLGKLKNLTFLTQFPDIVDNSE
jgi:hypothetical protein